MKNEMTRVLLIEDDEDDYILVKKWLTEVLHSRYQIEWAKSYETALLAIARNQYDVCLLDYRLGEHNGVELLHRMMESGCKAPVILLTGVADYRLDVEAMQLGAADFLVKDQLTPALLERSIRYAITQARTMEELQRQQQEAERLRQEQQQAELQRQQRETERLRQEQQRQAELQRQQREAERLRQEQQQQQKKVSQPISNPGIPTHTF